MMHVLSCYVSQLLTYLSDVSYIYYIDSYVTSMLTENDVCAYGSAFCGHPGVGRVVVGEVVE